jgi:hypothetical protein
MKRKILGGVLLLLAGLTPGSFAANVRLAIIPEAEPTRKVADVLTVALSSAAAVQLVERTDLDQALAEQARASGASDVLALGQILKADGVLLLSLSGENTNQVLHLRLLAVKPGVVVRQLSADWPPPDLAAWSGELAQRLAPLWPKLAVARQEAVPISVLNLRSAVRTTEAELLERELTTLLVHRLSQQPEVFVLERRRLELLAEEKEMAGDVTGFWSGGFLVEGLINKERYDGHTVTISGQLVPPNKEKITQMELTGVRTNLPALIEELSQRILSVVKAGPAAPQWNPAAEAAQYWEEAQWATKWRMWREAQAASEASWALGRQTKEVAELRIRAWRETGWDQAACTFELERVQVSYSAPPDADRFAAGRRAADLFEAGWKQFIAGPAPLDAKWFELGTVLVADLSAWLRHYYFMPEARAGQDLVINQTQQQAERICRLLAAHAEYPNFAGKARLAQTRALWGSLWVQTPEAGLKLYRELHGAGEWPFVRQRFLNSFCFAQENSTRRVNAWPEGFYDPASPLLVGWKWNERQRWPEVWDRFVAEWCNSTNPLVALEGRYLRCAFAWFGEDYERELRELLQLVWEQREALGAANLMAGWQADLRKLVGKSTPTEPAPNRLAGLIPERRKRIETELWPAFEKQLDEFVKAHAAQARQLQVLAEARNYFTTRNDYDFASFARWQREKFSPVEAGELLPLVRNYKQRLSDLPAGVLRGRAWSNSITRFEATLEATATGATAIVRRPATNTNIIANLSPRTNRPPVYTGPPGGMRPPGYRPGMPFGGGTEPPAPAIDLTTVGATNFFRGAQFWRPDRQQFRAWQISDLSISDVIFREGKLWAQVVFQEIEEYTYSRTDRIVICAIDPVTLATQMISVELDHGRLPSAFFRRTGERDFEIHQNAVYCNVGGKLRRYLLAQRRWEAVAVPVEGKVRLELVQDRLYLRTADSLMLLNPAGDGAEIIASARRRPAQNALDAVEQLGSATVFLGPTGSVCVAIQKKVWTYVAPKKDWEVLLELPVLLTAGDGNGIFYGNYPPGRDEEYYTWFPGQAVPELALLQPPDPMSYRPAGFPMRMGRPQERAPEPKPRWELPARIRPLAGATALASNQLWSLVGTIAVQSDQGAAVLKETNGRQGLLFGFDDHRKDPLVIPLKLEVPRDLASSQELQSLVGAGSFGNTLFRATPAGLVLTHHKLPGFWLLPQPELERQAREWQSTPPVLVYPVQTNLNANLSRP